MPADSWQPMSIVRTTRGLPARSRSTGDAISEPASTVGEVSTGRKPYRTLVAPATISSPSGSSESAAQVTKLA